MNNNWHIHNIDLDIVQKISQNTGIHPLSSRVLVYYGIVKENQIKDFIYPDLLLRVSPYAFKDMVKAVEKIRYFIDNKLPIYIFGDKDVDGITASAVLINLLEKLGVPVYYSLPLNNESYGFSDRIVEEVKDLGIKLLITVDCGIKEHVFVDKLKEAGVEVILTDHHTPSETLPDAYSILNPKAEDDFPESAKDLSGCAVAHKLGEAILLSFWNDFNKKFLCIISENSGFRACVIENLHVKELISGRIDDLDYLKYNYIVCFSDEKHVFDKEVQKLIPLEDFAQRKFNINKNDVISKVNIESDDKLDLLTKSWIKLQRICLPKIEQYFKDYIDLAGISTICDIMPLRGENRILVKEALKVINTSKRPGIQALNKALNYSNNKIDTKRIGIYIGPAINSSGRMGAANYSLDLLLDKHNKEIHSNVISIVELNEKRKEMGNNAFDEAIAVLEQNNEDVILFFRKDDIMPGITGIIAQKLSVHYGKPVFVLTSENEYIVGSGRSPKNVNILEITKSASEYLDQFGGHFSACGLRMQAESYDKVIETIKNTGTEYLKDENQDIIVDVVCELTPKDIDYFGIKSLDIIGPFGEGNEAPVFMLKNIFLDSLKLIGQEKNHIKFSISGFNHIKCLAWGIGEEIMELNKKNIPLDIIFEPEINVFRGKEDIQLLIKDIRPSI